MGPILHDPQRLNLYAYGLNNPYRYVDPEGKIAIADDLLCWGLVALTSWVMTARTAVMLNEQQQGDSKPQSSGNNKSTDKGNRRKNWIPEKGEAGTVKWNEPETTGNKYGEDGWVEKEYNKGHSPRGGEMPEVDKDDHVHEWKPNPNHPEGRPTRQPGRPPSAEDKVDFNR